MSPIRLVILAILIYIGYLLIRGGSGKKKKDTIDKDTDTPSGIADVLMEDPVCKKLVPKQQAVQIEHEGETIYFCSDKCCNMFISDKGVEK